MGKVKTEKRDSGDEAEKTAEATSVARRPSTDKDAYEALLQFVTEIATPMASRKLAKKLYKLLQQASKLKKIRQGVAAVQKAIRRSEVKRGFVILAGNVSPIEIFCHIPAVCEENDIPYVYTPSKEHLGLGCGFRRPMIMALVEPADPYKELFEECRAAVVKLV